MHPHAPEGKQAGDHCQSGLAPRWETEGNLTWFLPTTLGGEGIILKTELEKKIYKSSLMGLRLSAIPAVG